MDGEVIDPLRCLMLKQRIITAVVAALALLAVLFVLPQQAARVVIALLLLTGAWEWSAFLGGGRTERFVFVAVSAALMVPHLAGVSTGTEFYLVLKIALVWWALAFLWIFIYPTAIPKFVAWLVGILVIVPAYVAIDWLYVQGAWILLLALLPVWVADIGAYFSGKAFGRVKLAPAISPGKTWEGVIGGMLAVVAMVFVLNAALGIPLAGFLPLCLAVGVISIVGDLTVSMFKRYTGVKDSGTLFPGHGGFLDRADGITAAAPLFALGLQWIGSLPGIYPL